VTARRLGQLSCLSATQSATASGPQAHCRFVNERPRDNRRGKIYIAVVMVKDVAEYLKVTERTTYQLAAAKKIPAFKVGGGRRFSRTQ
jgi:excisionase family DNA binding protein